MRRPIRHLVPALVCSLAACSSGSQFDVADRAPGTRAPLTADCDALDRTRCLLPWPSSTFTVVDASTPTGLRVAVDRSSPAVLDDPASISIADGFSRLSPLAVGFDAVLDQASIGARGTGGALRLIRAQPGDPSFGTEEPLEPRLVVSTRNGLRESLLTGYPLRPLAAGSDYVAVAMGTLRFEDGAMPKAPRAVQVALALVEPASLEEARLAAYHAPTRAVLKKAGVAPEHVVRVWDFTTRSAADPTRRLSAMREASIAAARSSAVQVVIDAVQRQPSSAIAMIVEGRLTGLPTFLDADGLLPLSRDLPVPKGTREAPFRIVVPAGTGDYRVVMFGHGTGGSFRDTIFDNDLAARGFAKVAGQFYGWTGSDVIDTFLRLNHMFEGSHHSTSRLLQGLSDVAAIEAALGGVLGDTLAAPQIKGESNPAAGRHPDAREPIWAGGSLGGTLGLVHSSADPAIRYGVLNVPGAGWTHFITQSAIYAPLAQGFLGTYGTELDLAHAVLMMQNNWDDVDGGTWVDAVPQDGSVFLVQESMGDPVLPNPGTAMLSAALRAVQVGPVLEPIAGLEQAAEAVNRSGVTQYRVPDRGVYAVHGFAGENTPAGDAAREQIDAFIHSVVDGAPRITMPAGCTAQGAKGCDFSGQW